MWPNFKGTFGDYFYLHPNHAVFRVPADLPDELVVGVNCAMAQVTGGWDLAGLGVEEVLLYVESDNAPAVAVYSRLGFTHAEADTHVQYARAQL